LFDDVPVNYGATVAPSVTVTRVTFDVTQVANAPGTTVTAYYAPMVPDGAQFGGNNASDDAAWDDPGAPVAIGSFTPRSTINYTRTTITFGNGVNQLFTTPLDTTQNPGGPGYFFLGLKFSDTTNKTGWTIANPGAVDDNTGVALNGNLDLLFDYSGPTNFEEFTYGTDGNNPSGFIAGAQMFKVEGAVVPEPLSGGVVVLAGAWVMFRRRR